MCGLFFGTFRKVLITAFTIQSKNECSQTHRKVGTESHGSVTDSRVALLQQETAHPAFVFGGVDWGEIPERRCKKGAREKVFQAGKSDYRLLKQ